MSARISQLFTYIKNIIVTVANRMVRDVKGIDPDKEIKLDTRNNPKKTLNHFKYLIASS